MYRLLGFCLGSIASVSALMFLIGWPDFHLSGEAEDSDRYDVAVQKLKAKRRTPDVLAAAATPPETAPEPVAPAPDVAAEAAQLAADVPLPPISNAAELPEPPVASTIAEDTESDESTTLVGPPAEAWHTIWTPFRSRIAADGFVSRLESVTGLDYRVMQVKAGVYEVAFAYADQAELDTNLARISAATGLELGTDPP